MDKLQILKSKVVDYVQNNFLVVVIAGIIFLLFIPAIISSNLTTSQNSNIQTPPTPTSSRVINPSPIISDPIISIYNEKTAKDSGYVEVVEGDLNSDIQTEVLPDGLIRRTTSSENPARSNIVIVKDGSIIFMRYPVIGKEISDGYKNLHGKQSHTLPGPTFYGQNTVIYFYADGGTALIVNPQTGTTYEEFTFQPPISVEEFNQKYRQYIN